MRPRLKRGAPGYYSGIGYATLDGERIKVEYEVMQVPSYQRGTKDWWAVHIKRVGGSYLTQGDEPHDTKREAVADLERMLKGQWKSGKWGGAYFEDITTRLDLLVSGLREGPQRDPAPPRSLRKALSAAGWVGRRSELGAEATYTNREGNDNNWRQTLSALSNYAESMGVSPTSHKRAGEIEYYIPRVKGDTSRPYLYAVLGRGKGDGYDAGFIYISPQWPAVRRQWGR